MRKFALIIFAIAALSTQAFAVPGIQLFISGATYDWDEESWITTGTSFDLYVVSANSSREDIIVAMALAPTDHPWQTDINFNGHEIHTSDWRYGYAPLDNAWWRYNQGEDLPRHGVYPTWFTEINTGDYNRRNDVGDVQPDMYGDYWDPSTGEGTTSARGQFKRFHVETGGVYSYVHFDAYTLDSHDEVDEFAPFSHDAEAVFSTPSSVPEPGTMAMMSTGLLGLGLAAFRRRKS